MEKEDPFFKHEDFRAILSSEYQKRRQRHSLYSLRAFARDLDIGASTLIGVLNKKFALSTATAKKVAKKLRYSEKKQSFFCDLVSARHGRSKSEREYATLRLKKYGRLPDYQTATNAALSLFSKWYYLAVLELLSLHSGRISLRMISQSLNLTAAEADDALRKLMAAKVITSIDGIFVRNENYLLAESPTPAESIRAFHKQILQLAIHAVDLQPIHDRKNLSTIFTFNTARLDEARKAIEQLHLDFFSEYEDSSTPDSIYAASFQLFRVDGGSKL